MIQATVNITKGEKGRGILSRVRRELKKHLVLVGVTEEKNKRRGAPINNAQLMYIHTHGSPVRNIPRRPVIEPALMADGNRQAISEEMAQAFKAFLLNKDNIMMTHLKSAGMLGQNAARAWFTDPRNNWAPDSPATIRRKGSDRPLIDTGQLRKSITYVVR